MSRIVDGRARVLILTPLRKGEGYSPALMFALYRIALSTAGTEVSVQPSFLEGGGLPLARAELAHQAILKKASHACFVDADVAPTIRDVRAMLAVCDAGADAVCIPYANRSPASAGRYEYALIYRRGHAGPVAQEDVRTLAGERLLRVEGAGFGCVMLTAGALRKVRDAHLGELAYDSPSDPGGEAACGWFQEGPHPETRAWLYEDHSAIRRLEAAGVRFECLCDRAVAHRGLMPAQSYAASLGLASQTIVTPFAP